MRALATLLCRIIQEGEEEEEEEGEGEGEEEGEEEEEEEEEGDPTDVSVRSLTNVLIRTIQY
jgi:hypothetical protein